MENYIHTVYDSSNADVAPDYRSTTLLVEDENGDA
jgi:hypothetical protein